MARFRKQSIERPEHHDLGLQTRLLQRLGGTSRRPNPPLWKSASGTKATLPRSPHSPPSSSGTTPMQPPHACSTRSPQGKPLKTVSSSRHPRGKRVPPNQPPGSRRATGWSRV
ncbi:hypothetical protein E2542_SST09886 [Spatholobus suberectus]|nr:hypothetical protein E2542_SST09886 [Spatholobus suberectus]